MKRALLYPYSAYARQPLNRREILGLTGGGLLLAVAPRPSTYAQDLPRGPITIVIPTAAGGQADIVARLIGDRLSLELNRPVIIEPKPGAGGLFAAQTVARAEPNGTTLLFVVGSHAILPGMHRASMTFDAVQDFAFISTISIVGFIICVGPNHPAKTFQDLLDISRRNPDSQTFTSVGIGSTHHLIGELIKRTYGVQWVHVPYRGASAAMADVLAGRVSIGIETPSTGLTMVLEKRVKALAVTQAPRLEQIPDVPVLSEVPPGLDVGSYLGLAAPAKTPIEVISKYHDIVSAAVADPKTRNTLEKLGNNPQASTPPEFTERIRYDVQRWSALMGGLDIQR